MTRSKTTTAVAISAGVLTLGAGLGVASLASADPTPTPTSPSSASPSTGTPSTTTPSTGPGAADPRSGHRGFGRGEHQQELAKQLAEKLGVSQAKVETALQEFREANKPSTPPTPGTKPDPAQRDESLAKSLASKLGVDQAKVKTALQEIREARRAERAAALKPELDAAVKAGTLTQAEADAVTKAVQKGVINAGPR